MKYRNDKNGEPISILGFGCMRFTRKGPGIDIDKAEREILLARDYITALCAQEGIPLEQ